MPRKTPFTLLGWTERLIFSSNRNSSPYSYLFCINLPMRVGFSSLLQIKAKHRNRLAVEDDLRCAVSQTTHPASNYFPKTNKNKFHIDREENGTKLIFEFIKTV